MYQIGVQFGKHVSSHGGLQEFETKTQDVLYFVNRLNANLFDSAWEQRHEIGKNFFF